jgi:glycosyltransferase involved in cell wall biosynthesis
MNAMPLRFSFIVPFHRDLSTLARCLRALDARPPDSEVIIAADGALDDCQLLARRHGARVVDVPGPAGPATARNVGAAAAGGDVLVFVDADVAVSRAGVDRMVRAIRTEPRTAAVFGAYDEEPPDPGFMSQYKNLSHSFIHQTSATRASTFWAGFGAVRRERIETGRAVSTNASFGRRWKTSIWAIASTAAGYEVVLDPALSATHLKRWTISSAIVSDVRDRGIPWTQLIWRYGAFGNDLNLRTEHRWSVLLAYVALGSLLLAPYDGRSLILLMLAAAGLTAANRRYYRFFLAKRGAWFATRVWVMHLIHNLCNGLSFAVGTVLFFAASLGVGLPGSLPTTPWSPSVTEPERAPARQQA